MYSDYRKARQRGKQESSLIVLVTGASGYVATHLVKQLQAEGYRVRGTVRSLKDEEKITPLRKLCPEAKHPLELVEADLLKPESWDKAVEGCTYVHHVASPFLLAHAIKDENDVIRPAVEGTTNVMNACIKAKVEKVIVTSSAVSIIGGHEEEDRMLSEEDWTILDGPIDPYYRSKTLAEKVAWDMVKPLPDSEKIELVVLNPVLVVGPPLRVGSSTSIDMMLGVLMGALPPIPKLGLGVVDVRDVAAAHIKAMLVPEAVGKRHILCEEIIWMDQIAQVYKNEFEKQGYTPKVESLPGMTKLYKLDNTRMRKVLGVKPRPFEESLVAMAYAFIEQGRAPKTDGYTGMPTSVKLD